MASEVEEVVVNTYTTKPEHVFPCSRTSNDSMSSLGTVAGSPGSVPASPSGSGSAARSILPLEVRGMASRTHTLEGTMYAGRLSATCWTKLVAAYRGVHGDVGYGKLHPTSRGCLRSTRAWATFGWALRTDSISASSMR